MREKLKTAMAAVLILALTATITIMLLSCGKQYGGRSAEPETTASPEPEVTEQPESETAASPQPSNTTIPKQEEITMKNGNGYGAFLSISEENIDRLHDYNVVAIDVQYFSADSVARLKQDGKEVMGYLNIGSLEDFRNYYDAYVHLTFMDYENWDEERWIDISAEEWQSFIIDTLAADFKAKGADGVYMDNLDVYSVAKEYYGDKSQTAEFYSGIKKIIQGVAAHGLKVVINGGSEFLEEAIENNDNVTRSIYAYHQEEVFTVILDYDNDVFGEQDKEDSEYYQEVIKAADNAGMKIFLLEYTTDEMLIEKTAEYCEAHGYYYYCSPHVALN